MTYQLNLVCTEDGRPKKFIEVDEDKIKKENGSIDNMNHAFQGSPSSRFEKSLLMPKISFDV